MSNFIKFKLTKSPEDGTINFTLLSVNRNHPIFSDKLKPGFCVNFDNKKVKNVDAWHGLSMDKQNFSIYLTSGTTTDLNLRERVVLMKHAEHSIYHLMIYTININLMSFLTNLYNSTLMNGMIE